MNAVVTQYFASPKIKNKTRKNPNYGHEINILAKRINGKNECE